MISSYPATRNGPRGHRHLVGLGVLATQRVLVILLAVAVALVIHPSSPTHAASRQDPVPATSLSISLDRLSPTSPTLKSELALSGTVTNNSDEPLTGISITLRLGTSRATDPSVLANMTAAATDVTTRGIIDGTISLDAQVPVGQSQNWAMVMPISNLQLGTAGVYFIRLDAVAIEDGSLTGSTGTFLPWFPNPDSVTPAKIVWLWPLSDYPNRDAQQILLNDRTPAELAPGGRLQRLLDLGIAAQDQASLVVDPQLLETVDIMARGYQVINNSGQVVAGSAQQLAEQWLARARNSLPAADLYAMAYANPDVTALTRARLNSDVVLATASAPEQVKTLLGKPVTAGLGWPAGTSTDAQTLNLLATAGVRTTVLDSDAYPASTTGQPSSASSASFRTSAGPMPVVLANRLLSESLGTAGSSAAAALSARQQFLAQAAIIASEAGTQPQTVVVAPDPRWDPNSSVVSDLLSTMQTSSFVRSTSLAKLLAQPTPVVDRTLAPVTKAQRRIELTPEYLAKIRKSHRQLDMLASVLVNPDAITGDYRTALLRAESAAWRIERNEGDQLLERTTSEVTDEVDKVHPLSSRTVTFASNEGSVPITIANELSVPVRVGLKLTADPTVRLTSEPMAPFVIPANRKVSVEVPATVRGSGELPVAIQLTTPNGGNYGPPASVKLRTTAYAQAATWVVVGAFVVLTVLLMMNSVKRRRQRRADLKSGTDD